jgi:hypothetical protein
VSSGSDRATSPTTFVDFDHTLLGANSTELFLAHCRPYLFVAVIDFVIRRCIPWRLTRIEKYYRLRDYIGFVAVVLLTPWNIVLWRRRAPALFEAYRSKYVEGMLDGVPPQSVVVVSFGIDAVIRPMLAGGAWSRSHLIATPLLAGPQFFETGKAELVESHCDRTTIAEATFITDSEDDRDLLAIVRNGLLIPYQGDKNSASHHLYMPLRYTLGAKYPRGYAIDQFLFVDILLIMIAAATSISVLPWLALVVPLLVLSFMCVYEIGYYENDFVGANLENAPTLLPSVAAYRHYPIQIGAWVWALVTGFAGISLGVHSGVIALDIYQACAAWLAILIVTRSTFFIYNRRPAEARVFMYVMLQVEKYGLIFILLKPSLIGMVMVASHVTVMWMVYIVYRVGGKRTDLRKEMLRAVVFGFSAALLYLADPQIYDGEALPFALIVMWSALRIAKAPLMRYMRNSARPA